MKKLFNFSLFLNFKKSRFYRIFLNSSWKLFCGFIKKLWQAHKFLLFALILSFICAIIPCLYSLFTLFEDKYFAFIFLIPFFAVLLICVIALNIHKYVPKLTNVLAFILNSFIIIIIQMFVGLFVLSFLALANDDYMRDKPEFYEEVLTHYPEEKIAHFPLHIPKDAKNIEMDADMWSFQGGQSLIIKFDTNKNYIEKELKKHKFKSQESPQHYVFDTLTDNGRIEIDDFTFLVMDGDLDRFGKNYGIAINKTYDKIIYYYSNPD